MYVFVDTETNGFGSVGLEPRLVSFSWMISNNPHYQWVFRNEVVRPEGFSIPCSAVDKHGISTEIALNRGVSLDEVLESFISDLSYWKVDTVIAHNLHFDIRVIDSELRSKNIASPFYHMEKHCTLNDAKQRWPKTRNKLELVFERLFNLPMQDAHNAAADVWACSRVFFAMSGFDNIPLACPIEFESFDQLSCDLDKVLLILDWARKNSYFDCAFVSSLHDRLNCGRNLTDNQRNALNNIINKLQIE